MSLSQTDRAAETDTEIEADVVTEGERSRSAVGEVHLSRYLLYTVSLPERVVRSTVGVAAGAAREAAHALIPQAFQSSKTYELVVTNSLKFLVENVGGVELKEDTAQSGQIEHFLARKAVGNFVDLAGVATLHLSPIWVFAVVSDVAYGSKAYLRELAAELQQRGLIKETSTIDRVDDLLEAIQRTTAETASLISTPPLSVDQLKLTLERTRAAIAVADLASLLPEAELHAHWRAMRGISTQEGVSLLGVSGAITLHMLGKVETVALGAIAGVEVAGGLLNRNVVGHYVDGLRTVREQGFYHVVRTSGAPYAQAVWRNFATQRETLTSQIVTGRLFGTLWKSVRKWFRRHPAAAVTETGPHALQHASERKL
jgi:hypothetical protein